MASLGMWAPGIIGLAVALGSMLWVRRISRQFDASYPRDKRAASIDPPAGTDSSRT